MYKKVQTVFLLRGDNLNTSYYEKDNLVASGVAMEAISIEDNGEGIKFHIYVYNVQNGITIDYLTGDSYLNE